ncbi:oxygen-independent coproporphyrinogen-3 oxidase [Aliiruegeria haliotis]|uniref:Coproporphyrinogen-III oxidase n=1 Tax=Aliiruegeria haliotis TaxID=1280846 RepID=A0A2T0RT97_9RHOB|nr:oxygen-independent coproporphyrinogen III oxidase [Aliiruegeria haliotis]PRY24388.1 oxygen-independent coproporphyrinogen-3 oxidase [Aliiruegeria haliotis]
METVSQLARLGLFDARVPRYTSYPTAPHFNDAVGHEQFLEWTRALPADSRISLYVHIPFCRRLCWFCACRTQGTSSLSPVGAYLETLKAEIDLFAASLPSGVKLSALHWGGGTPTLLDADMIADLADSVFRAIPAGEGFEFSVEIDPNEIDDPRLDALARAGMTRASIGVQDFDPEIQKIIGREQSFEVTQSAVDGIRARGVDSLNTDILYGLPDQSRARISDSVQKLLSLSPDRVALYGYAHVPWMARRQTLIPSEALPTPQERLKLFDTARRLFLWDGYDEIGIDHFARKDDSMAVAARDGSLRRNFQGYTVDPAPVLVGLGASAISRFPQGYAQNLSGTGDYTRAIRDGRPATGRGHTFQGQDLMRARMIETLMCSFRIDRQEITDTFGVEPGFLDAAFAGVKERFEDFVEVSEAGLSIPIEGRPLARMIAKAFDVYAMDKAGHSHAI